MSLFSLRTRPQGARYTREGIRATENEVLSENKDIGGGGPNLVEPQALTVSIGRKVVWRKDKVDLIELAKLRWVDKWTIERLASHFGLGTTSIKMNLRLLKK